MKEKQDEFKDFTGDYEKQFYDILLPCGTIIEECWPNAGYMNAFDSGFKKTNYGPGECKIRKSKETKYHK